MREIATKYDGACKRCGADLPIGAQVMYEKSMGVFCTGCEPTTVEEIRSFRLAKAERKADRYEEWAAKREKKATAQLNSYPSMRHDYAFNTQPGHIPARTRMRKADDRAFESLGVAKHMREKADSLRHVRVAGDAERKREETRKALDTILSKGSRVKDFCFGEGNIISVHKKSYRIKFDQGYTIARDKSYVIPA